MSDSQITVSLESSSSTETGSAPATMSFEELFEVLIEAYEADGSGMHFWETARSQRKNQVFDEPFMEYLTTMVDSGSEEADLADKVRAKLSNPLLRQPAPFEV